MRIATITCRTCYDCPHSLLTVEDRCAISKYNSKLLADGDIPDWCPLGKSLPQPFMKGQRVRYIPNHANGNIYHGDCRNGVVKRPGDDGSVIFVLYDQPLLMMITGDEPFTAQATDATDLIHL